MTKTIEDINKRIEGAAIPANKGDGTVPANKKVEGAAIPGNKGDCTVPASKKDEEATIRAGIGYDTSSTELK